MLVFLVDDDPIQNMITSQLVQISSSDAEYKVYSNGKEVIDGLETGLFPDVILLDINMPIMNGFDFLKVYKDYPQKANVFMLTSSLNDEDKGKASKYACVKGYYTKPVSPDKLSEIFSIP